MSTMRLTLLPAAMAGALVLSACGAQAHSQGATHQAAGTHQAGTHQSAAAPSAAPSAADLRVALGDLLREHVVLASAATGAALGGRTAEFQAAADALDANSVEVSQAIGSVYGADAEAAFLPLWRRHIGFVVDYTTGVATQDTAKQEKAVADLVAYTEDFGAFLSAANPTLTKDAVAGLVKDHVLTLKGVIDAQAAGDHAAAFAALREASDHMSMMAKGIADAISAQFPGRFV